MDTSAEFNRIIRTLRLDGSQAKPALHCLDLVGPNHAAFSKPMDVNGHRWQHANPDFEATATAELFEDISVVRAEFPDVIGEVRTRDSVIEMILRAPLSATSRFLRLITHKQMLTILLVAYLFHEHQIRAAGEVGEHPILQLRAVSKLAEAERHRLRQSLRQLCKHIQTENVCALTRFLSDSDAGKATTELFEPQGLQLLPPINGHAALPAEHRECPCAAWVCHLVDAIDLPDHEPSFQGLDGASIERALYGFRHFAAPIALPEVTLTLANEQHVKLLPIWLPVTSRAMKNWLDNRELHVCRALLTSAIELAHRMHCQVVSLGQFTSIVSRNGKSLVSQAPEGLALTNGNSYTVSLAIQAIAQALKVKQIESSEVTLLVGGALGNIGRVCVEALASQFRETLLLGSSRPGSMDRLRNLATHVPRASITTDLADVRKADVVILALNAVNSPLTAEHFAPNSIVCDISVPSAVNDEVATHRTDVTLLRGGIAHLPGGEAIGIPHFPLPAGQVFGCMAEGILLAASGVRDHQFTGQLSAAHVQRVEHMAAACGIRLADAHCTNLFGRRSSGAQFSV